MSNGIARSGQANFRIVGAGFAGLVAAYELVRQGYTVEIFEKMNRVGGLIATKKSSLGLVETAANGVLNTALFEELCRDLNVPLVGTQKASKKRYIFRNKKPRRLPLSLSGVFKLLWGFSKIKRPVAFETIADWGKKNFGSEAVDFLIAPALQGIYAGDAYKMSSSLILNRFFIKTDRRPAKLRGSVSPQEGMGQLMEALHSWLLERGVVFHLGESFSFSSPQDLKRTLVATSASSAAEILKTVAPKEAVALKSIEMLPLVRATLFFKEERKLKGFGCLFPPSEKFNSLGVLFDDSIFDRPQNLSSQEHCNDFCKSVESWILGGAFDKSIHQLADEQIVEKILMDRARVLNVKEQPIQVIITRWPEALPHYTCHLEKVLLDLSPEIKNHLIGNYLGKIGLSQILEETILKVQRFAMDNDPRVSIESDLHI